MKPIFALLAFATVAACSHDPLDPGNGNEAGSGSKTLLINGDAVAQPRTPNAKTTTDFDTDFTVEISLNNVRVMTGTVTVKSKLISVPLVWHDNGGQNGRWEGTAAGYDGAYQLDIVSGTDSVSGVIVDGPDIHTFTAPMAGASLDSTLANDVKWSRDGAADVTTFRVGDLNRLTIEDTGLYSIPPGTLRTDQQQSRENTIDLTRTNHVVPAGAVGGSDFGVGVQNELQVVALPVP